MHTINNEIFILLDSSGFGGIESHVLNLARGLKRAYQPVCIVFYQCHGSHDLAEKARQEGIALVKLDGRLSSLYRLLNQHKPHILHTHGYKSSIIGRVLAKILSIAVVSTHHAGEPGPGRIQFYTYLDRLLFSWAVNIAVSKTVACQLPAKAAVIANFVACPAQLPKKQMVSKSGHIAFVGRLSHEKGPDCFMDLASQLTTLQFSVFGDGPMRETLQRTSTANVHFQGNVSQMQSYWQDIDYLCITSRHEGLPLVALEAMANGVIVIAFSVGGLAHLIQHGKNGYLISPADTNAMAQMLIRLMSCSEQQLQRIRRQARHHIQQRYSTERLLPRVMSVYRYALSKAAI
ncbi:MAG: glycosyltransferase family 4 protein [Pseudomonadales bacterium]|nr:glycosyltransferase family 4 protein [Pseudomonadales bacterium]